MLAFCISYLSHNSSATVKRPQIYTMLDDFIFLWESAVSQSTKTDGLNDRIRGKDHTKLVHMRAPHN